MIFLTLALLIIGLSLTIVGIYYDKKSHKNLRGVSGGDPIGQLIIFILALLPWYVMKTLFILLGLLFFVIAILANL